MVLISPANQALSFGDDQNGVSPMAIVCLVLCLVIIQSMSLIEHDKLRVCVVLGEWGLEDYVFLVAGGCEFGIISHRRQLRWGTRAKRRRSNTTFSAIAIRINLLSSNLFGQRMFKVINFICNI